MSEFFITGKPRGGKTFLAVKFIYEILLNPKDLRPIVTNVALNLDVIAEELKQDLKLEFRPDLTKRIRIIDAAETGEFWLYSLNSEGQPVSYLNRKSLKMRTWSMDIPDFEGRGSVGCWYFIDEVHIYFPATFGGAKDTDDDLRFFLSQHGKMNIDIIFITQHPEQTSKILRRLAQEYMHVRNLSREPYLGFRIGNLFRYVRSLNSPTSANPAAFESDFVSMNFSKFGKMFDTTAGVGIAGSFIHEPAKRGRSLWWLTVPLVLFVLLMVWLVFYAPKQATEFGKRFSHKATAHLLGQVANGLIVRNTNAVELADHKSVSASLPLLSGTRADSELHSVTNLPDVLKEETNEVVCTGYTMMKNEVLVFLSDGETYTSQFHEVDVIEHRRVRVLGKWYNMTLPPKGELVKAEHGAAPFGQTSAVRHEFPKSIKLLGDD